MNSINITGNLTATPELKTTVSGKSFVSFTLAVKRPFSKDTTDFIPIVAWEKTAEAVASYSQKGDKLGVSGKLTTRNYEDKHGNKRTAFEVLADSVDLPSRRERGEISIKDIEPELNPNIEEPKFEELAPNDDLPF